jgi:hypothetical protein
MSRDSSVGIAASCRLDGRDSISGRDKRFLSSPQRQDRLWGHQASYPMGTGGSFPAGKAAGA